MEFFAVTMTSVYRITDQKDKDGIPIVEKIALRGKSKIPIGGRLKHGSLVGISRDRICLYHGKSSQRLRLEEVTNYNWGGTTSPIAALFLAKEEARNCFSTLDLKCCDPRWRKQTEEVITAIGDNNPVLVLSKGEFAISFDN